MKSNLSNTCTFHSSTSPRCTLIWLIRGHPWIIPTILSFILFQHNSGKKMWGTQAPSYWCIRPSSSQLPGRCGPLGKLKTQHAPSLAFSEQLASTLRYNASIKKKKKGRERAGVFITHGTMAVSEVAVHPAITNTTWVYLLVPGTASWLGSCFCKFLLTSSQQRRR